MVPRSRASTSAPASLAVMAAHVPAMPSPTTTTSAVSVNSTSDAATGSIAPTWSSSIGSSEYGVVANTRGCTPTRFGRRHENFAMTVSANQESESMRFRRSSGSLPVKYQGTVWISVTPTSASRR